MQTERQCLTSTNTFREHSHSTSPGGHDNMISINEATDTERSYACRARRCLSDWKRCAPILGWFPTYKPVYLLGDMIAGLTVGLTAVPQVMAYANLAGLQPQFGLYSSFMAPLLYIFLGSCHQVTIGPTAIISLVAFETCGHDYPECVVLASFWAGVFALLLALFRLGAVVSLIAEPVTIGFTTGAAITVSSSQIKSLFGIAGGAGNTQNNFIGYWSHFLSNLHSISVGDSVLGCSCLLVLFLFQNLNKIIGITGTSSKAQFGRKCIWILSISRNVLVVTITTLIAYIWTETESELPFQVIGPVQGGFPPIGIPHFLLPTDKNHTSSADPVLSFWDTWSELGSGPLIIALIAILQNVAIAKVYGSGQRGIDGGQEMFALGVCNVVGSFFSAQPVSGSFSRSAVNEASGVRSPLSGLFTSAIILLSLGWLTPAFTFIPKAGLAAIIIAALLILIEYDTFLPMWKVSRLDSLTCAATFLSSLLLGMEYGIGLGAACSVAILLYKSLSSQLISKTFIEPKTKLNYMLLRPLSGPLQFPIIDVLRAHINSTIGQYRHTHHVLVLDCLHWTSFDYSGISALGSIIRSLQKQRKWVVLLNCRNRAVWAAGLGSVGIPDYQLFANVGDGDEDGIYETELARLFGTVLLPLVNARHGHDVGASGSYQDGRI